MSYKKKRMNISVCLASYNGEKYVEEQLKSIIIQLSVDDEIIIVDDCSKDSTVKVIKSLKDERIKIFKNEVNKGHVYSFGKAISLSNNEIVFMSDQDDIWTEGRVDLMKSKLLNSQSMLLSSNSDFINSFGEKIDFGIIGVQYKFSKKNVSNIFDIFVGKENYYGCAMAFKKELKEIILPIPTYVESHDLWIAMAANLFKSNLHCDEITLSRRVHGSNASIIKRPIALKIWSRYIFVKSMFQLIYRGYNKK